MAWINGCDSSKEDNSIQLCPSCSHPIPTKQRASSIQELPGLPAGVKFDPTDQELLEHLEGKVRPDSRKLHPLIDDFIPTLNGENGICYTHPEKLPGVSRDGQVRHFFHCPSKAYTTGTRKRRKVDTNTQGGETRWHKTGKTRPILADGAIKGYKKILVLYTNYGKLRKPEKTNWVMHQYHLGSNEEETDGELVVSKVFYQTQPRQCGSSAKDQMDRDGETDGQCQATSKDIRMISFYDSSPPIIACNQQADQIRESSSQLMLTNISVHENASSFLSGL